MYRVLAFFLIFYFCIFNLPKSNGDLTRQNPIIKKVSLKGVKGEGYYYNFPLSHFFFHFRFTL